MLDSPLDSCAGESIFLPVLTVLPEFGGPFIWIARRPDVGGVGPCLCDSMGWSDTYPLSEGCFSSLPTGNGHLNLLPVMRGTAGTWAMIGTGLLFTPVGCSFRVGLKRR